MDPYEQVLDDEQFGCVLTIGIGLFILFAWTGLLGGVLFLIMLFGGRL